MKMRNKIQGIAEALNECDGAAAGFAVGCRHAGPAANRGKDSAHEDLRYVLDQRGIIGKAIAKRIGDRQHPLTHRHFGKYTVHEMRGRIGHAAATAEKLPMHSGPFVPLNFPQPWSRTMTN